jgi:hypothetical protein
MNQQQIRVNTGNPVSALFLALGRDAIELFRNPLATVGGIGGLALTSLALFLGSEAMADASDKDCERLTLALDGAKSARDEVSLKLAAVDTDLSSLQARLEGIDTNLTNAPTPELQSQKTDLEAQIKDLQSKRPALEADVVAADAVVTEHETLLGDASCEVEDDFEIDFTPGTLARLGEKLDEKEIPQKIIVQETRAEDFSEVEPVKDSVTTDEKVKPSDKPPEEKPKDPVKDKPKFQDNKDKKLPTSKVPTTSNTPYNKDLPTVNQNIGDPFGDPEGWDDLTRDGDPWATEVMKRLNNMPIGAYAAKAAKGDYKFQLTICKDGKIKDGGVLSKGGSLPEDGKNAVRLALESLEIPKPPKKVADSMPGNCAKLKYTFVWSAKGVK